MHQDNKTRDIYIEHYYLKTAVNTPGQDTDTHSSSPR